MNSFIESLNLWGGKFSGFAWPVLWQSSLLMIALLAFDFMCRRSIRASIRYALWLVVLVKLCLPPTLALPTSPAWWLFPSQATGRISPVTKYVVTYDTTEPTDYVQPNLPAPAPLPPKLNAQGWLLLGSGFVSVGLLLWLAMRWWQISRKVSCASASVNLTGLLDEIRVQAGLRAPLRLKLVEGQMSPAVCGLFRPVILLPRILAEQLSAAQLRAVLLHEAFHLRRKDVWVNCAQALFQIVYWWHPLLWVANARIRRLREEAVDDAVMLALSGEAESYAPALLAVAKLAFSRPLMSLGLVGIMESRSALRKRIERLVNFTAPRKAGLTLLSLGGILVFSAVALPMGQAPSAAPDSLSTSDASEETTLTVKVDPDVFIRNVKSRADWTVPTGTNDYTDVLLDILQGEGVDCNPPHHIAFNTKTGEMTMQNTPEQLEVFRHVIEQLNRVDGKAQLPLQDSPIHRQSILIEARFFQMPSAEFENLVRDLHAYNGYQGGAAWWSVAPDKFDEFNNRIASLNLKPFLRPRIQTAHGMAAEMFIGTQTNGMESRANGVELDCRPMVIPGGIDLAFRTQITGDPTGGDQTLVGTNRYQIHGTASAENYGGIVLRADNPDGSPDNLVMVLGLHIVTNAPPAHFQERLQAIVIRSNNAVFVPDSGSPTQSTAGNPAGFAERARATIPDNMSSARDLVRDGKLLYEMGKFDEAEVKLNAALALNPDDGAAHYYLNLVQVAKADWRAGIVLTQPGPKEILAKLNAIHLNRFGPFDGLTLEQVVRHLGKAIEQEGIHLTIASGSNSPLTANIDPLTGLPPGQREPIQADAKPITIKLFPAMENVSLLNALKAVTSGASRPINFSIQGDGIVFSEGVSDAVMLFMRTFKVDQTTFISGLKQMGKTGERIDEITNSAAAVSKMAKAVFSNFGVNFESPPGKSAFYNDRLGLLFVKATESDLDTIERAVQVLNDPRPQIHIKARFVEVPKQGFVFSLPGTNGSASQATGILSDPQMRTFWKSLEAKAGFEVLAEPEVVTLSGRQTQMRATQIMSVVTNFVFQDSWTNQDGTVVATNSISPQVAQIETGPVLDVVPYVLSDGYTVNLTLIPSLTEFLGYDQPIDTATAYDRAGKKIDVPKALPELRVRQVVTTVNVWDNQTVILSGLPEKDYVDGDEMSDNSKTSDKELLVLITATLVDPAGNRVHSDDEMPFAKAGPPPQPH